MSNQVTFIYIKLLEYRMFQSSFTAIIGN